MEKLNPKEYVVYDAKEKVLGRLASTVAKELLNGKSVAVVNADEAVVTGDRSMITQNYKTRVNLVEKSNPDHSPYWPRRPDMLVRRIIRGMLPYRRPRGKDAYRRLRVFSGVPEELKGAKQIEVKTRSPKSIYVNHVKVSELSKLLGYNN